MIPASYLFRTLYRSRFEPDSIAASDAEASGGHDGGVHARRSRVSAAIIGFALGSPSFVLGGAAPLQPARRR